MATTHVHDIEQSHPLLQNPIRPESYAGRPVKVLATTVVSCLLLASLVAMLMNGQPPSAPPAPAVQVSGAWEQGVSDKKFRVGSGSGFRDENGSFVWTNAMLTWQRTGYHFQPQKNWINDPNGPLYHMGWYHLFYQYNPDSAVWGNITWGHAVSSDLINWLYLPLAMVPDEAFDLNGVWTGSATLLPNGDIVMLYTGDTDNNVQVTNLAYPSNLSDPLLLDWTKYPSNPVMTPPDGIGLKDFRDPTTAWLGPDGLWRVTIGSKVNNTGIALVYKTSNFTTFHLIQDHVLHSVPSTGMWECVDFYPVSPTTGLDTSQNGPGLRHVLKASLDDDKHDWYAIGTYDGNTDTWTPDDAHNDLGIGLRLDYGKYYASKTFYDQNKARRILWAWAGETDSQASDLEKRWASIQTIPRVVTLDNKTGSNIIQWPVEELDTLRSTSYQFTDILVESGSVVNLHIGSATQLDVLAEFVIDGDALNTTVEADVINNCTMTTTRGVLGPFGLLVLSDDSLSELTPVYFYIAKSTDGTINNWFCTDKTRSTKAPDVDFQVYGGPVPVLDDENYNMRILVDHSVVEAFAQGGRTCITSRIYPTEAIDGNARLFVFNNATDLNVTATVKVWEMNSTDFKLYPLDTQM